MAKLMRISIKQIEVVFHENQVLVDFMIAKLVPRIKKTLVYQGKMILQSDTNRIQIQSISCCKVRLRGARNRLYKTASNRVTDHAKSIELCTSSPSTGV